MKKTFSNYVVYYHTTLAGAGVVFYAEDTGKVCLVKRSAKVPEPLTWAGIGGKLEEDESPTRAIWREVKEEAGFEPRKAALYLYDTYENFGPSPSFSYFSYLGIIPEEFTPKLNWENDDFKWCDLEDLPEPLHPEFAKTLWKLKAKLEEVKAK